MRVNRYPAELLRVTLFILSAMLIVVDPATAGGVTSEEGQRVALVIGNSSYRYTTRLQNTRADSADVAAALATLGFTVIEKSDLDKAQMEEAIGEFSERLGEGGVAVFYFAGHGLQADGQNYLVPVDAKLRTLPSVELEAVKVDSVLGVMEGKGRIAILFLDACRNNPLAQRLAATSGARSAGIGRGLAVMHYRADTLLSFATQPNNVAEDGTGRNSPFTGALVTHMLNSEDSITDMLTQVRIDVLEATGNEQVPWDYSSLTRKFHFKPRTASAARTEGGLTYEQRAEIELWNSVKNSRSAETVSRYIDAYPNGVFLRVARVILSELGQSEKATAAAKSASRATAYDGRWKVVRTGKQCPTRSFQFELAVEGSTVGGTLGPDWTITGKVKATGEFEFSHDGKPSGIVRYNGSLKGESGSGNFNVEGGKCHGTFTAKRM